ncbi:alpha/beta hydrolase [Moheibacter lacus]|uniref:Alpha/beta hydrolase n=1 Tax=Moheibacter lacus TaxID=2745851 RepID=A0A838ZTW9_9FLAO|nr:alpha/beta hydrolase [Moheibacter lacus]MBA5630438.1 alpha/beta hydrolase [Moheibacter lacus]
MKIYRISGLGANDQAFKWMNFPEGFEVVYLPWLTPEPKESLAHYAERMAEKVDTTEDFVLMGLSFGGIIVQEMNRFLHPKLNILISTVKSRNELPGFMKMSAHTQLHKLIPNHFFDSNKRVSYAMIRKFYDAKMPELDEFFEFRDPKYLHWAINEIVNWKNTVEMKNYVHYHGNKDVVFPFSKIQNAVEIDGGTHLMVMQKAKKLNELIKEKLVEIGNI